MGCPIGQNSLFGSSNNYIKFQGGDLIAIEGANTVERQMLSSLRFNYKQILRGRVFLRPGQVNYLLNHLGLGDNATLVSIAAKYDAKSKIEEDNYILWSFFDDLAKSHPMCQYMFLSGNSTNRISQLYITNPNQNYGVELDVMVGVIDEEYSLYTDGVSQSGSSFTGLEYTDIKTYIVGESIVINDKKVPVRPLVYLNLSNINSIQRTSNILIVDDESLGTIFLQFLTEFDALQSLSLLNYILENPMTDIATLNPISDTQDPILYFYETAGVGGNYISFNGLTNSVPYDTSFGNTFSTSISLSTFGTASGTLIDRNLLIDLLVDYIDDNRDGLMTIEPQNLIITGTSGTITSISSVGTYSLTFDFSDLAQNYLDGVVVNLNIT